MVHQHCGCSRVTVQIIDAKPSHSRVRFSMATESGLIIHTVVHNTHKSLGDHRLERTLKLGFRYKIIKLVWGTIITFSLAQQHQKWLARQARAHISCYSFGPVTAWWDRSCHLQSWAGLGVFSISSYLIAAHSYMQWSWKEVRFPPKIFSTGAGASFFHGKDPTTDSRPQYMQGQGPLPFLY